MRLSRVSYLLTQLRIRLEPPLLERQPLDVLGEPWLPHFSAVFTLLILMFSEIIPKTIGVVYARHLVSWIAYPIQLLIWTQAPLIWLCQFMTRLISRGKVEHVVSSEELIALVQMGRRGGNH